MVHDDVRQGDTPICLQSEILLGAEGTLHTHLRKGENLGMRTASVVPVAPLPKIGFNDNDLRELGWMPRARALKNSRHQEESRQRHLA